MPYYWPADTDFALWELDVLERDCPVCGRMMYVCDHRYRRVHTLEGPVELVCKLNHCPDPACAGHSKTRSPETEVTIALPKWAIGWDVLCWIGHRRCSRHWAIPQIRGELWDDYRIALSEDSIARYIRHYQNMLAARQEDEAALRQQYEGVEEIILTIDGRQPEKGHETLYVVREVTQKRVWFGGAVDLGHCGRSASSDRQGQSVGGSAGQEGGVVVVGSAGRVCDGDRGGISGDAASLLRQSFSA